MFENDSIQAFHKKQPKKPLKMGPLGVPKQDKRDDLIMDTNNSSIVSKRSVEKLYYSGQTEFFRDPLPFQYLGNSPELCHNATFVDVDYPQLMQRKLQVIQEHEALHGLLKDLQLGGREEVRVLKATGYNAYGCDLRNLDKLEATLREDFNMNSCSVAFLFVAEVSVAYMDMKPANDLIRWASKLGDARFCLLEQHLPDGRDHPFAKTMLKHFEKQRAPLNAIGTMDEMRTRFSSNGWVPEGVNIRSLWDLWSDNTFLSPSQRQELDSVEPFDEWEEFALFGSHYFLLVARMDGQSTNALRSSQPVSKSANLEMSSRKIEGKPIVRRFGACLLEANEQQAVVVNFGGLGPRERQSDCDILSTDADNKSQYESLPAPVMCHTITSFRNHDYEVEYLLVGGRTSPDKASKACYVLRHGSWEKTDDLPDGRFRHCAAAVWLPEGDCGIVVGCGKDSSGRVLDDWLLWSAGSGWTPLKVEGEQPCARFGAAMTSVGGMMRGVMVGGMSQDGTIIDETWDWKFSTDEEEFSIQFSSRKFSDADSDEPVQIPGRFGATLVEHATSGRLLLIGGVKSRGLLTQHEEILDLGTNAGVKIQYDERPLLVGMSAVCATEPDGEPTEMLVMGGGVTCFSFGTCWSTSYALSGKSLSEAVKQWHSLEGPAPVVASSAPSLANRPTSSKTQPMPEAASVQRCRLQSAAQFDDIRRKAEPVIIEGLHIGACNQKWTPEYLRQQVGADRQVVIHDSPTPHMDFQSKNFSYSTTSFGNLIDSATSGKHVYLRALSAEKPADKVTHLSEDFPTIAADFQLPPELAYVSDHAHSSPLRISGPVTMWLHYDVMANVLCQVKGSKRLLLYPPSDVTYLAFAPGASSSSINPFTSSTEDHPDLQLAHPHEVLLNPGDVLFIPPLWLHTASPTEGLSIAVNVFFRDDSMEAGYAAGKDVYGNRDLAMYERGRRDVQRIDKSFEGLPQQVKAFYVSRLAEELRQISSA
ncbi:hypothetical protein MBLNU457_5333t2 [Dothideomycetes sp. NU457]